MDITLRDDPGTIGHGPFGYHHAFFCDGCKRGFDAPACHIRSERTYFEPEDGEVFCPHCGSIDFSENENRSLRATKRFKRFFKTTGAAAEPITQTMRTIAAIGSG